MDDRPESSEAPSPYAALGSTHKTCFKIQCCSCMEFVAIIFPLTSSAASLPLLTHSIRPPHHACLQSMRSCVAPVAVCIYFACICTYIVFPGVYILYLSILIVSVKWICGWRCGQQVCYICAYVDVYVFLVY